MKRAAENLGRILIVASIVWMLHNYYSNWHYHRLPNGVLVVHAHPFSAGEHAATPFPVDNHKHEVAQVLMLDYNHLVFVFGVFLIAFGFESLVKRKKKILYRMYIPKAFYGKYFHLRAPPSML